MGCWILDSIAVAQCRCFASAQQAPTGKVATGERWTLMGHALTCSGTDLGWVWSLMYPRCPPDMSPHNLLSPTHYKKLPLVECKTTLSVPCAVPNIPAQQDGANGESQSRLSPTALLVREHCRLCSQHTVIRTVSMSALQKRV